MKTARFSVFKTSHIQSVQGTLVLMPLAYIVYVVIFTMLSYISSHQSPTK